MSEDQEEIDEEEIQESMHGRITVWHLALIMSFVMTVAAVFGSVRASGGGLVRYLWGLVIALSLGGAVVFTNWGTVTVMARFARGRSERLDNLLGMLTVVAELAWGILGMISGSLLVGALIRHAKM